MPEATPTAALHQLRSARKRARTANIDWVDAMYRAYILALVGVVAVLVASGYVGDTEVTAKGLTQLESHGAAAVGALAALAVAIGIRSGARGGPLALEAADVRHVLLAPIDRGRALRDAAVRQMRHALLGALAGGAVAGQLAARRLPHDAVAWTVCAAGVAALAGVAAVGAGYVTAGRRVSSRLANLAAFALLAWSAADLATEHETSPFTLLGRMALWPIDVDPLAAVGIVVCLALAGGGLWLVAGLSIEAAERRSALIGRLAFAATLQDLRTVLVLRRQLAQEHARRHPWARRVLGATRWPVWARGWRGVLRWPFVRIARVLVLGAIGGVAATGIASGTTPLVVVCGVAFYIAALDSVEALAQEVDHPSRTDGFPVARGSVHLRHLPVAAVVMTVVALVGLGAAFAVRPEMSTLGVGAVTLLTAVTGAVAGAAIGTVSGPPDPLSGWAMGAPEIAGIHTVLRLLWPPALAIAGFVPVIVATRLAERADVKVAPTLATTAGLILLLEAGAIAWVHARDSVLESIRTSFDSFGKAP